MQKGFTLLETLIAITFLSVALLLFYNTFFSFTISNQNNILYDDASNIYKTFFLKEYLNINNYSNLLEGDITELTCANFNLTSCHTILKELNINKIYLTKYKISDYNNDQEELNKYLKTLSTKDNYQYRFVAEFKNDEIYSYASLNLGGDNNE